MTDQDARRKLDVIRDKARSLSVADEMAQRARAVFGEIASLPPQQSWRDAMALIAAALAETHRAAVEQCAQIADHYAKNSPLEPIDHAMAIADAIRSYGRLVLAPTEKGPPP